MPKHQEYRGNRRNRRATVDSPLVPMHTCPGCGKQAFTSRKDAKAWAKRVHQGQQTREHQCRNQNEALLGNDTMPWHVTTMGSLATAAYKDWEASGRKPLAEWKED